MPNTIRAARTTRACARCHMRKVKCNGAQPACANCVEAGTPCEPHERRPMRRAVAQKQSATTGEEAQRRVRWLEQEMSSHFKHDFEHIKTGEDLRPYFLGSAGSGRATCGTSEDHDRAGADISLLTLNATGEMRYLGPSSGSFIAHYVAGLARTFASDDAADLPAGANADEEIGEGGERMLTPEFASMLLGRYMQWVHSVYPLFTPEFHEQVLKPLCSSQAGCESAQDATVMAMFYLIMALGAVHIKGDSAAEQNQHNISPNSLFTRALAILGTLLKTEPLPSSSVVMPQIIVLICIYGSYRPSGNAQWQLSGIAMRMCIELGLHRDNNNWKFTPAERQLRRCVFWTAYTVEITVAFNLGRPPSITEEHIDAKLPEADPGLALAVHHVRHRQIQARMMASVYGAAVAESNGDPEGTVENIQRALHEWFEALRGIFRWSEASAYPLEYWQRLYYSTMTALHRPSPLVPKPTLSSAKICIRSSGAYIEILHQLMARVSIMPQSWMFIQGLLLAGTTMLFTAKTYAQHISGEEEEEGRLLLEQTLEWGRECSIVLAIMMERWQREGNSRLLQSFEDLLAGLMRDMVRTVMRGLSHPRVEDEQVRAVTPKQWNHGVDGQHGEMGFEAWDDNWLFGALLGDDGFGSFWI
ncbi:fungal-specific transcription factor domain-containing protein [Sphaerosporella brunnea]|uniref:Fungal-specific transcription factor domain-containing protein n=1 Tax=Sphaerosporella brunnea TaxID=1250544 RepID=A0A5J5F1N7_9PEZI|nr:fungal-specific transcription factor domain-containing protein [Sphaerosporella brunnea]